MPAKPNFKYKVNFAEGSPAASYFLLLRRVTSLTTLPRVLRIRRKMRCSLLNSSVSMDIARCEMQKATLP